MDDSEHKKATAIYPMTVLGYSAATIAALAAAASNIPTSKPNLPEKPKEPDVSTTIPHHVAAAEKKHTAERHHTTGNHQAPSELAGLFVNKMDNILKKDGDSYKAPKNMGAEHINATEIRDTFKPIKESLNQLQKLADTGDPIAIYRVELIKQLIKTMGKEAGQATLGIEEPHEDWCSLYASHTAEVARLAATGKKEKAPIFTDTSNSDSFKNKLCSGVGLLAAAKAQYGPLTTYTGDIKLHPGDIMILRDEQPTRILVDAQTSSAHHKMMDLTDHFGHTTIVIGMDDKNVYCIAGNASVDPQHRSLTGNESFYDRSRVSLEVYSKEFIEGKCMIAGKGMLPRDRGNINIGTAFELASKRGHFPLVNEKVEEELEKWRRFEKGKEALERLGGGNVDVSSLTGTVDYKSLAPSQSINEIPHAAAHPKKGGGHER